MKRRGSGFSASSAMSATLAGFDLYNTREEMMVKTVAERLRALKQSRRDAGLVRVEVWVPADAREQVNALAENLRDEHFANRLKDRK